MSHFDDNEGNTRVRQSADERRRRAARRRIASRAILAAIIVFVALAAFFAHGIYREYQNADISALPATRIGVAPDGVGIAPTAGEWEVSIADGNLAKTFSCAYDDKHGAWAVTAMRTEGRGDAFWNLAARWFGGRFSHDVADPETPDIGIVGETPFTPTLTLPEDAANSITLVREPEGPDAEPLLEYESGQGAQHESALPLPTITEPGAYRISITSAYDKGAEGRGAARYEFVFSVKRPDPKFFTGSLSLEQGDVLSMAITNLPDDAVPVSETDLGPAVWTQVPGGEPGAWYCTVPIGNQRSPGTYTVETRTEQADGTQAEPAIARTDEVSVLPFEFDHQNLIIDTSAPGVAAAVTRDAIAEFQRVVASTFAQNDTKERYWENPFAVPVGNAFISTQFGEIRITNGDASTTRSHYGMDYAASTGEPVHAGNRGKVLVAEMLLNTGGTVVIDHGGGLKSYYYHMSKVDATPGGIVEQGAKIGEVGSTGYSTGPHLHYEMRIGDQAVSPSMMYDAGAGIYGADTAKDAAAN